MMGLDSRREEAIMKEKQSTKFVFNGNLGMIELEKLWQMRSSSLVSLEAVSNKRIGFRDFRFLLSCLEREENPWKIIGKEKQWKFSFIQVFFHASFTFKWNFSVVDRAMNSPLLRWKQKIYAKIIPALLVFSCWESIKNQREVVSESMNILTHPTIRTVANKFTSAFSCSKFMKVESSSCYISLQCKCHEFYVLTEQHFSSEQHNKFQFITFPTFDSQGFCFERKWEKDQAWMFSVTTWMCLEQKFWQKPNKRFWV